MMLGGRVILAGTACPRGDRHSILSARDRLILFKKRYYGGKMKKTAWILLALLACTSYGQTDKKTWNVLQDIRKGYNNPNSIESLRVNGPGNIITNLNVGGDLNVTNDATIGGDILTYGALYGQNMTLASGSIVLGTNITVGKKIRLTPTAVTVTNLQDITLSNAFTKITSPVGVVTCRFNLVDADGRLFVIANVATNGTICFNDASPFYAGEQVSLPPKSMFTIWSFATNELWQASNVVTN